MVIVIIAEKNAGLLIGVCIDIQIHPSNPKLTNGIVW